MTPAWSQAGGRAGRGRAGEEVAQAHAGVGHACGARPRTGPEHADLGGVAEDRAPDLGDGQIRARRVDDVAGGEIVRAVQDDVVALHDPPHIGLGEPLPVLDDGHVRVERPDVRSSAGRLRRADAGRVMDHLPVEVGQGDGVVVDDPDRAHARGRQIEEGGRTEAPRPDDEHARGEQAELSLLAEAVEEDLA